MIDENLREILLNKKIDNFVEAFIYLKNAGYNEMSAFFNALEIYGDALFPNCVKIIKVKHKITGFIGYKFIMGSDNTNFNNFIAFCVSSAYYIGDLHTNSLEMIIEDNRFNYE